MLTAHRPLLTLTAEDLMTRAVVTIPAAMPLRTAARLLEKAAVSGAPVVDSDGRCVGVLSASDFLAWVGKGEPAGRPWSGPAASTPRGRSRTRTPCPPTTCAAS